MQELGYKNFQVRTCLYELNSKSFFEHSTELYDFHILVSDFLKSSMARNRHNMTRVLNSFWKYVLQEYKIYFYNSYIEIDFLHPFKILRPDVNIMCSIMLANLSYHHKAIIPGMMDCRDLHMLQTYFEVLEVDFFFIPPYKVLLVNTGIEDLEALTRILDQDFYAAKSIATKIRQYYIIIFVLYGCPSHLKSQLSNLLLPRVEKLQQSAGGSRDGRYDSAVFLSHHVAAEPK